MTDLKTRLAAFRESMADEPWFEIRVRGGHEVLRDTLRAAGVDTQIVTRTPQRWSQGKLTHVSDLGDEYTESEARVSRIFDRLTSRIGAIIMGAADKAVRDSTAQLQKAKSEIDAEVSKLQESGVSDEALAGLKSVSQSLDDVNPDPAPEPEPATDAPGDTGTNADGATDTSE